MSRSRADSPKSALDSRAQVLAPRPQESLQSYLESTRGRPGGEPFDDPRIVALQSLSKAFLDHSLLRNDPASVAVAYWMRRSETMRLRAVFERSAHADSSIVRVPVGRVFHVAPSNVDTLFIYSWALSFLCGNLNVVRVSQDRPRVVEAMLEALQAVATGHPILKDDRFVTYAHDDDVTAAISAWCGHRVIWGGNETAALLRRVPLNPHASERIFGSKFSYSVMSAARFHAASEEERARVAAGFFNDLFWFDQMACSSPHVIFWVGAEVDLPPAIETFKAALQAEIGRRGLSISPSTAVHRRAFAFDLAASAEVRVDLAHPGFVAVETPNPQTVTREICGGGLIQHTRIERLVDLVGFATESDQTVTHFGFEAPELQALAAQLGARGVDRLVPIGEALAFDVVWDGFDLLDDFTRRVRVR